MFDACYVLTLAATPNRLRRFMAELPQDWPFPQPQPYYGVNGWETGKPAGFAASCGAWGCYRGHLRIWEDALTSGLRSILVLEDDAIFRPGFSSTARAFVESSPPGWDMLYFGGQAMGEQEPVGSGVMRCSAVVRTHAYAISHDALVRLYPKLAEVPQSLDDHASHVDARLADCHVEMRVYAPETWLVGQARGISEVHKGRCGENWFGRAA